VAIDTGKAFTTIWAMHFKLKDGKLSYVQTYEDTASTAAAFGK
jgi:ketosteroid isomerase-like protein